MENNKKRLLKRPEIATVKSSTGIPDIDGPSNSSNTRRPLTVSDNPLLGQPCIDYLNYRIQQEEYSSRIYLSMSMWLNNEGYTGAASLWRQYSDEEMKHADIARNYMLSFGIQPVTPKLDEPEQVFSGLPEIIQKSFEHEIEVSMQIKEMASHALSMGDHILYELCLAYLKEQVEEHDKTQTWVDKLKSFGTDKIALRLLDDEMTEMLEN